MSDEPFPGSSADFYEQIQVLKSKVESGRVELRQQWERMQKENLALKDRVAEKDAEVQRLKEELELERHISGSADAHIGELRKLITELCDALEETGHDADEALIKRAREATRCQ